MLVRVDDTSLDPKYGGQGVGGSDAIRSDWDRLRRVGATARALLVASAAAEWGVPATECDTGVHTVRHAASKREARFGTLVARAATLTVPRDVPLKDPSRYRLIGTRVNGADNHKVVTGQPLFGIDVRLPNMKFAAVAKCPVFNGRPVKFDATKARQVPGVRDMIEITGLDNPTFLMPGVAVVADSTWAAFKGRDALVVQWEEGPYANESNATLTEQFQKLLAAPPATLHNSGRVEDALASAAIVVDNTFSYPVRLARHARAPQLQRRISRWRDVGARSHPDADERAIDRRARHRAADRTRCTCTRRGSAAGSGDG